MSPPCSPIVPFGLGVESYKRLGPYIVLLPKQLRDIHIEWTVRLRACQQLVDARHGRCDGVCRCPAGLEQVQADFTSLEINVWVADGRDEADGRRGEGVVVGDVDIESPAAACA